MDLEIFSIEELNNKIKLSTDFGQLGNFCKILEIEDKLLSVFKASKVSSDEKDSIKILHSILYWFPFDIRGGRDELLFRALQKQSYDLAKYLIDLGSIPSDAILTHHLSSHYHIDINFIMYCMERKLDIGWLYKLPVDSQNNIMSYIGMTDNEEVLLKIFKYLTLNNQFPLDDELYDTLVKFGYNDCVDFFMDSQLVSSEVILVVALANGTSELVRSLLKRGTSINIDFIKKCPIHVRIEEFTNIMLDQGYAPMEILDLIKYLF